MNVAERPEKQRQMNERLRLGGAVLAEGRPNHATGAVVRCCGIAVESTVFKAFGAFFVTARSERMQGRHALEQGSRRLFDLAMHLRPIFGGDTYTSGFVLSPPTHAQIVSFFFQIRPQRKCAGRESNPRHALDGAVLCEDLTTQPRAKIFTIYLAERTLVQYTKTHRSFLKTTNIVSETHETHTTSVMTPTCSWIIRRFAVDGGHYCCSCPLPADLLLPNRKLDTSIFHMFPENRVHLSLSSPHTRRQWGAMPDTYCAYVNPPDERSTYGGSFLRPELVPFKSRTARAHLDRETTQTMRALPVGVSRSSQ